LVFCLFKEIEKRYYEIEFQGQFLGGVIMGLFDLAKLVIDRMNSKQGTEELINVENLKFKNDITGLINVLKQKTDEADLVVVGSAQIALGEIGESALEPLMKALKDTLKDGNKVIQENIAGAIGNFGKQAVVPLISALEEVIDPFFRRGIAIALGETGDKRALAPLVQMLRDVLDVSDRLNIASALASLGEPAIVPLIEILKNKEESKDVRLAVAFALFALESNVAVAPLLDLLKDKDKWVRAAASQALITKGMEEEAFYEAVDSVDFKDKENFDDEFDEMLKKANKE
jgi:HEAT repeat protein